MRRVAVVVMRLGGKMPKNLEADVQEVLISAETINARIAELAAEISADYAHVDDILLVGVLKGSVIFMSDISRALTHPHELGFMAVSSYGASTKSSGVVQILLDLRNNIADKHVLIIEDIIDSGRTLAYLRELLSAREPASLKICTLLNKPSRREVAVPVDYIGFDIPDEFVVGYGLDFNELYRNIPYIAVLKPDAFESIVAAS